MLAVILSQLRNAGKGCTSTTSVFIEEQWHLMNYRHKPPRHLEAWTQDMFGWDA
jgi:hypothetical protein